MSYSIISPLSIIILIASQKNTKTKQAHIHLRNGICFRCSLIKEAYRLLLDGIKSLKYEETKLMEVNIYVNSIYINIRGVIDNLSWYLKYEFGITIKNDNQVDLKRKEFKKELEGKGFNIDKIEKYDNWFSDLKQKRDPIAHRLPLYIPYRIITNKKDADDAQNLYKEADEKLCKDDKTWASSLYDARRIGEFKPTILKTDTETGEITTYPIEKDIEKDLEELKNFVKEILQ